MTLELPALIEVDAEIGERCVELGNSREEAQSERLLFERANEALGAAVALQPQPLAGS